MAKFGRDTSLLDAATLAKASDHHTGAEIEAAYVDALHRGFAEEREPGELDLGEVLSESVPLAVSMSESIERLRHWASGRARGASGATRSENRAAGATGGLEIV